jgi:crotonobetainyl-CoA:carnitine CoA-transferase CaiB-like acyl-CoA transferase
MLQHMAGSVATGLAPRPMPARLGAWAIYDVFDTADGEQLFIGVTSDQQWVRFTEAFALATLAADPRLATNPSRANERAWLIPALRETIKQFSKNEVQQRCEAAAVSWAPVGKPTDLFADPHLMSHGGLLDVAVATVAGGAATAGLPALPVEFGPERERPGLTRQPPGVGEHTTEVLREAGFSAAEIARLAETRTIAAAA